MTTRGRIRLATRGSDLALRQAGQVRSNLEDRRYEVDVVEVETEGDRVRDELIHRLGRTGAFVRALDERVLDGDADLAVHSMKDMPTESPDDLVVAAIPDRGAPGDVLVTPDGASLAELPDGATVGTSSLRRRAQLLAEWPDLEVQPLRGNVDTRVEKLLAPGLQREFQRRLEASKEDLAAAGEELPPTRGDDEPRAIEDRPARDDGEQGDGEQGDGGEEFERDLEEWFDSLTEIERRATEREVDVEYDAVVLAEAGLGRSGLLDHVEYRRLPIEEFVPAPGQGALAVTASDGDLAEEIQRLVDHPRTRVETTVERTILAELGGGCVAPIGVYAVVQGEYVRTVVRVLGQDGDEEVRETRDLPVERHAEAARDLAADLAEEGAADLIEAAKREAGDGDAAREDG